MTVPVDFNTRTEAVGNGVSTIFPYDFLCLEAGDMQVSINGEPVPVGHYSVTGLANQQGGDVVFVAPPASGSQILMELAVVPERAIDYQNNGDLHADTLNFDFDRIWLAIRSAYGWIRRGLMLGPNDIDGQGAYRARGNRITNLGDPKTDTDAVNQRSMISFVREYVERAVAGVTGGFGWFLQTGSGAVFRTFQDKLRDTVSVKDFGAIGDGINHPLSERFASLALAQAAFPNVPITSLTQSIDWAACQAAVNSSAPRAVYVPRGTYVLTDEILVKDKGVTILGDALGYARSQLFAPGETVPCARFLAVGTGAKAIKTRRLYRGGPGDPNDAPLSTLFNIQNDGFSMRTVMVDLYCDYTNASPSNLGDNWDVGIFHGSRLDMRLVDVNVRGYWREAAIWLDSTRGVNLPELNGYPYTTGAGSDGVSLVRVMTTGGKWGIRKMGPLPKSGLMHFGFQYKQAAQFSFSGQPADGDTITIGAEVFTFRTSATMRREVAIGASLTATIDNLVTRWQQQPGRLVPYDVLTLTRNSVALEIYSTAAVGTPTALAATGSAIAVRTLGGGSSATQTVSISDPAPFYDSVTGSLFNDGRGSLGASDFVVDNSVIYSIEHHSGQAITQQSVPPDPQNDTCAGALWIDGLGGSGLIHRQFLLHTRFHSREPYNIKLGFVGRYRQTNCTQDGSPPATYGRTVASPTKSALLQVIGYDDPGNNFPMGLNGNQLYTGFFLQGFDVTAKRDLDVGGFAQFGLNNTDTDTGFINLVSGKNANAELRMSTEATATVGRIRTTATGGMSLATRANGTGAIEEHLFMNTNSISAGKSILPSVTGTLFVGSAERLWQTIYAVNGTINTSDARLKTPVRPMTSMELAAAKELAREIGLYKRLDAIEREGDEAARFHAGMTVQRAIEILTDHGLDPFELGFICYDQWDDQYRTIEAELKESGEFDETGKAIMVVDVPAHQVLEVAAGDRYGFRMDELTAFMLRGMAQVQDDLEARVQALEGRP
ncbi:tail fiber domain-containing protein [Bordetella trematum]|uniref:tail fiber domain-containing protein n=1 Tax=Bordetella trematum TaxID=123899 RepID=UPI003AF36D58